MIYGEVVAGVDGSPAGYTALAQAIRLARPGARVLSMTVVDPTPAPRAGLGAGRIVQDMREHAEATRREAAERLQGLPAAETRVAEGRVAETLFAAVRERDADLLALGDHGGGRVVGVLMGSVATRALRDAPCSVLIARGETAAESFASQIVVGVDGSAEGEAAYRRARALADAAGATLRAIAAGREVDMAAVRQIAIDVEVAPASPTEALIDASGNAELLIVGSRGVTGLRALGSVSERVGHRASCSVLVVRELA
jgi:nucleotide-binding universal stress UspA family protein